MNLLVRGAAPMGIALLLAGCTQTGDTNPVSPSAPSAAPRIAADAQYEVTVENLTPDTGDGGAQVFSPLVYATHNPSVRMFRVGKLASPEMASIAEDAVSAPMLGQLAASKAVYDSGEGAGLIFPGASGSIVVDARPGQSHLSLAFMLVNTNDAFGGVDSMKLPRDGERTFYLRAYDAGSEVNTELKAHIPGPCCGSPGAGVASAEPIHAHAGIQGVGELDVDKYGWPDPVARVTVRRMN